jgi:hypothetical protein
MNTEQNRTEMERILEYVGYEDERAGQFKEWLHGEYINDLDTWQMDKLAETFEEHKSVGAILEAFMSQQPNISCSQCGQEFGPGDRGFSSCDTHAELVPDTILEDITTAVIATTETK